MPQYLVTNYLPDNFDPSTMAEATVRAIDVLNESWKLPVQAHGLRPRPASQAKSVRGQPNGEALITDGPYLEAKEHIGGFWILEAADMDEALGGPARPLTPGAGRGAGDPIQQPWGGTPHPSRLKP